jgi:DNA-binding NtrC family response regulator
MARKKRILLFEDFESIRNVLIKTLNKKDCELIVCDKLNSAREQLNGVAFDLIICDNDLKERACPVFVDEVRNNISYLFTPMVLLITGSKENYLSKYGQYNIGYYLSKPFDMNLFNSIIDRWV